MKKYKGRIVEIEKYQSRAVYIEQGIKGQEQYRYNNYPGGNGTYVTGGDYYGTVFNVKIFVFDFGESIILDVYRDILKATSRKRISPKLLQAIESHKGRKVDVYTDDGANFYFEPGQLLD